MTHSFFLFNDFTAVDAASSLDFVQDWTNNNLKKILYIKNSLHFLHLNYTLKKRDYPLPVFQ